MFGKQRQEDATSYGIIGMGRFGSALACTLALSWSGISWS